MPLRVKCVTYWPKPSQQFEMRLRTGIPAAIAVLGLAGLGLWWFAAVVWRRGGQGLLGLQK
jgi:hypothetical protein